MLRPPVGGGERRKYLPLAWLLAGTTLGGMVLGAGVVAVSLLLAPAHAARTGLLVGGVSLGVAALIFPGIRRWLPERPCQVPRSRLLMGNLNQASFHWGLKLGFGLGTFVVTPALYGLLVVAISQEQPVAAGLLCVTYGVTRGATIVGFALLEARRDASGEGPDPFAVGSLERALRRPLAATVLLAAILVLS